jgi:hypothetical protein
MRAWEQSLHPPTPDRTWKGLQPEPTAAGIPATHAIAHGPPKQQTLKCASITDLCHQYAPQRKKKERIHSAVAPTCRAFNTAAAASVGSASFFHTPHGPLTGCIHPATGCCPQHTLCHPLTRSRREPIGFKVLGHPKPSILGQSVTANDTHSKSMRDRQRFLCSTVAGFHPGDATPPQLEAESGHQICPCAVSAQQSGQCLGPQHSGSKRS